MDSPAKREGGIAMGLAKILEESQRYLGGNTGLEDYPEGWNMYWV